MFDFNAKGGPNEWTALHFAIYATNLSMITTILSSGEKLELFHIDK